MVDGVTEDLMVEIVTDGSTYVKSLNLSFYETQYLLEGILVKGTSRISLDNPLG